MLNFTKAEFELRKDTIYKKIIDGAIFVHPTDTIYGLGCDATNSEATNKLRKIKSGYKKPFSVMAPSKKWIRDNCIVEQNVVDWLVKLPGPYTLILKLKEKNDIAKEVNNSSDTIGVRIPEHWFHNASEELDIPIVTTSANLIGGDFMSSIEDLDPKIKSIIDFIVYDGEKKGKPSTIIDLTKEEEDKITKRK